LAAGTKRKNRIVKTCNAQLFSNDQISSFSHNPHGLFYILGSVITFINNLYKTFFNLASITDTFVRTLDSGLRTPESAHQTRSHEDTDPGRP